MPGRECILAHPAGVPVDCLPAVPMTFAAGGSGVPYLEYGTGSRVLVNPRLAAAGTCALGFAACQHETGGRWRAGAGCEPPRAISDKNRQALLGCVCAQTPEPAIQRSRM